MLIYRLAQQQSSEEERMKKYEMIALATQLDGATAELMELHAAIKGKKISTDEYREEAEQLFTSVEGIWNELFELTVTVINIDNPVGEPTKTLDQASFPKSTIVQGTTKAEQAARLIRSLPKEVQEELLTKLGQKTQAEDKS